MTNLTCGRIVKFTDREVRFCGEPAMFRFAGPIEIKVGETYIHALERRGRVVVDLCMDHSREAFIRMEPALQDHTATMRCLVQTKLTLHCMSCHSLFRLEPLRPAVMRTAAIQSQHNGYGLIPNHFCPNCGAPAVTEFDSTLDYWELLSADLDLTPSETQEIYSLFLADKTATAKFVDYVKALIDEVDAEEEARAKAQ